MSDSEEKTSSTETAAASVELPTGVEVETATGVRPHLHLHVHHHVWTPCACAKHTWPSQPHTPRQSSSDEGNGWSHASKAWLAVWATKTGKVVLLKLSLLLGMGLYRGTRRLWLWLLLTHGRALLPRRK